MNIIEYDIRQRLGLHGNIDILTIGHNHSVLKIEDHVIKFYGIPDPAYYGLSIEAFSEANIVLRLDHPHIVKFEKITCITDCIGDNTYLKLYSMMKYAPKALQKNNKLHLLQIIDALCALHECGIIHSDVKCANIRIDNDDNAILIDFGLSVFNFSEKRAFESYYAPFAPEMSTNAYDEKVDVFAFGVMLYELYYGSPNKHQNMYTTIKNVLNYGNPSVDKYNLHSLMLECVNADASSRINMKELLHHPYFKDCNYERKSYTFKPFNAKFKEDAEEIEKPFDPLDMSYNFKRWKCKVSKNTLNSAIYIANRIRRQNIDGNDGNDGNDIYDSPHFSTACIHLALNVNNVSNCAFINDIEPDESKRDIILTLSLKILYCLDFTL